MGSDSSIAAIHLHGRRGRGLRKCYIGRNMLACSGENNEELRTENEAVPAARIWIISSDKQKSVEQLAAPKASYIRKDIVL